MDEVREPEQASQRALLDAYAEAFSNADVGALTKLLREDAVLEMPPQLTWFAGREQVGRFLASRVLTEPGRFAMTGIAANGQPALAAYLSGDDGVHRAHAIQVLTFSDTGIGRIVSFNDAGLFPMFGLPGVAIPAGH
jgi:RNA polymerase sigma-70 factor (ECF subfamily)